MMVKYFCLCQIFLRAAAEVGAELQPGPRDVALLPRGVRQLRQAGGLSLVELWYSEL